MKLQKERKKFNNVDGSYYEEDIDICKVRYINKEWKEGRTKENRKTNRKKETSREGREMIFFNIYILFLFVFVSFCIGDVGYGNGRRVSLLPAPLFAADRFNGRRVVHFNATFSAGDNVYLGMIQDR